MGVPRERFEEGLSQTKREGGSLPCGKYLTRELMGVRNTFDWFRDLRSTVQSRRFEFPISPNGRW